MAMIRGLELMVSGDGEGERLDRFLVRAVPGSARAFVVRAIEGGKVKVDGRAAAKGMKLREGAVIRVDGMVEAHDLRVEPESGLPLEVVRADDSVLVLNKPAGMPTHPLKFGETGTLANAMVARFPETAAIGDQPLFPALIHRLDTDTSGLVLAARTADAYRTLREDLRKRRIEKIYVALVHGTVEREGRLVHNLHHDPRRPGRVVVARPGRAPPGRVMTARLAYRPVLRFAAHTLLEVTLITGVTHQIRCQLAAAGHPLAGDALYGDRKADSGYGLRRQFLHARRLVFRHPASGQRVEALAPLPPDLEQFLTSIS